MDADNPCAIEERYTRATTSSNLRCKADERSDVDILIACGLTPGILGGALMRLASEFDSSSEKRPGSKTDAILLMGRLKSLPRVLEALEEWALLRGLDAPGKLAQAAAAYYLDSKCTACEGRGHERIAGTPMLGRQCKVCRGTGKRKEPMGDAGRLMLNVMDDAVMVARNSIKRRLRNSA